MVYSPPFFHCSSIKAGQVRDALEEAFEPFRYGLCLFETGVSQADQLVAAVIVAAGGDVEFIFLRKIKDLFRLLRL